MSESITIQVSPRQLWAMVILLVMGMGGGSTYVGKTANDLNVAVEKLSVKVDLLTEGAESERTRLRERLDRLEQKVFP